MKTRAIQQLYCYYCMALHLVFEWKIQKKTLMIISKYIVQFQRQEDSFPIPFRMISLAQCQLYSFYHSQLLNEMMNKKLLQIGWDLCIPLNEYNSHRWETIFKANLETSLQINFSPIYSSLKLITMNLVFNRELHVQFDIRCNRSENYGINRVK